MAFDGGILYGERALPDPNKNIIMVQWKMAVFEGILLLDKPIFHFHDYGRRGIYHYIQPVAGKEPVFQQGFEWQVKA